MEIVTKEIIDPSEVYDKIQKQTVGSVVLHFAVVREKTRDQITESIEFQRAGDIESELKSICDAIQQKWKVEDVLIIRRLGLLEVGDIISLVAASAPHKEDAFDACQYGVKVLKKMKTIRKKEKIARTA
jgi:molybdopterin synthase catalytic subunit